MSSRATQVVAAARHLLETEGAEAVTMRRIAEALGIRAPSIYKHFPGKEAVEVALIEQALLDIGEPLHRAVASAAAADQVSDLLSAYRSYATAHPSLYRLATTGRLARSEMRPGLEDWAGEPFFLATGDPYVAQALWSFAHGMVILELDRRFPDGSDLSSTWAAGAKAFGAATLIAQP
jgi:AcrR family transcriptional regulator